MSEKTFKCDAYDALPDEDELARLRKINAELLAACRAAPILSKYHSQHGFEIERFIADYEAWTKLRCSAISAAAAKGTEP